MSKFVKKLATSVTKKELANFKKAKKYVRSFCGNISDAEVLRFLIRNWQGE